MDIHYYLFCTQRCKEELFVKHIPNILSAFRIVLIPVFVWLMLTNRPLPAAGVLLLSGITDFLDGMLARKFGWITPLGKVLDPVADKLTMVTVCIIMAVKLYHYWVFFALILFKDLVMLILGGGLVRKGVKLEGARWFGKVVTFMFYAVMLIILFFPTLPEWVKLALLVLTTVCAWAAGVMYIPEYIAYRKSAKKQQ